MIDRETLHVLTRDDLEITWHLQHAARHHPDPRCKICIFERWLEKEGLGTLDEVVTRLNRSWRPCEEDQR